MPRTEEKNAMLLVDRTMLRPQMRSSLLRYMTATAKAPTRPFRSWCNRSRHTKDILGALIVILVANRRWACASWLRGTILDRCWQRNAEDEIGQKKEIELENMQMNLDSEDLT